MRERLRTARDEGAYTNASLGRTINVKNTTVMSWLGQRAGDLTLNHYLQLCIVMGVEPAALIPEAIELENEFIRAAMNEVNRASPQHAEPLEPGQYPNYTASREHWEPVEELALYLLNRAIGEELSAVGIETPTEEIRWLSELGIAPDEPPSWDVIRGRAESRSAGSAGVLGHLALSCMRELIAANRATLLLALHEAACGKDAGRERFQEHPFAVRQFLEAGVPAGRGVARAAVIVLARLCDNNMDTRDPDVTYRVRLGLDEFFLRDSPNESASIVYSDDRLFGVLDRLDRISDFGFETQTDLFVRWLAAMSLLAEYETLRLVSQDFLEYHFPEIHDLVFNPYGFEREPPGSLNQRERATQSLAFWLRAAGEARRPSEVPQVLRSASVVLGTLDELRRAQAPGHLAAFDASAAWGYFAWTMAALARCLAPGVHRVRVVGQMVPQLEMFSGRMAINERAAPKPERGPPDPFWRWWPDWRGHAPRYEWARHPLHRPQPSGQRHEKRAAMAARVGLAIPVCRPCATRRPARPRVEYRWSDCWRLAAFTGSIRRNWGRSHTRRMGLVAAAGDSLSRRLRVAPFPPPRRDLCCALGRPCNRRCGRGRPRPYGFIRRSASSRAAGRPSAFGRACTGAYSTTRLAVMRGTSTGTGISMLRSWPATCAVRSPDFTSRRSTLSMGYSSTK